MSKAWLLIAFFFNLQHQLNLVSSFASKEPSQVLTQQQQQQQQQQRLVWECGCVCNQPEEVWLWSGDGKLGVISTAQEAGKLTVSPVQMISRVICAHYLPAPNIVLVGTLDFHLAAIDCSNKCVRSHLSIPPAVF